MRCWLRLGGYVDGYSETFNVTSRTSGFVPGAPFVRHFQVTDFAVYVQDKWKVTPRLDRHAGPPLESAGRSQRSAMVWKWNLC